MKFQQGDIVRPVEDIVYRENWVPMKTSNPCDSEQMFRDRTYRVGTITGPLIIVDRLTPGTIPEGQRDHTHGMLTEDLLVLVERDGKNFERGTDERRVDRFESILGDIE